MPSTRFGGPLSRRSLQLLVVLSVASLICGPLAVPPTAAQERESIFDRVVHLEPAAITEIPETPRLEERLGIEGRRISVGDVELWVEEEGEGIPMVLINGGPGGTHHGFHPWFGRAADFARVIYYDQRGCGLSEYEPGPDGYSVHQAMEDLEALRQALGLERFILAGFSYGGFLAQYYTAHHPENVAGLVLVGALPGIRADLGQSRQQDFISPEERARMQEARGQLREIAPDHAWTPAELLALVVYNNHINGDWKRQHYYKPSPERLAQIALYEWVQDENFNGTVGQSMNGLDLTGAFDASPIPTLILEGEWDLTWGPEKRDALAANHPNGKLVTFEKAGHSIFDEDPEGFFSALQGFVQTLAPPDPGALASYEALLGEFRAQWATSRASRPNTADWGWSASQAIAANFGPRWAEFVEGPFDYLRLGFALYDMKRYEDALEVFKGFQAWGDEEGEESLSAVAAIWQGHMLDLLGRRSEAVTIYQHVVDLDLQDTWSHDQYGLRYALSPWAAERLETPFRRIENRQG